MKIFSKMQVKEEELNANYCIWQTKLKQYNCYSQSMDNEMGEKIKNASFYMNMDSGAAYKGSLLKTTLNVLCTIASHINQNAFGPNEKAKQLHPFLYVNQHSLMRVLLLQHISKADMFEEETENWKINKGLLYTHNKHLDASLKCGERSVFLCMQHGIKLSELEFEAMRIIDREDECSNPYLSQLAELVKISNQLTAIECRRKFLA